MFSKENKCPICGKKMKYSDNNQLNCSACGYYDRTNLNTTQSVNNQNYNQTNTNNIYSRANNTYTPNQMTEATQTTASEQYIPPVIQYSSPQYDSPYRKQPSWIDKIPEIKQKWKSFRKAVSVIITAVIVIVVVFVYIYSFRQAVLGEKDIIAEKESSEKELTKDISKSALELPDSDLYKEILPVMFDKAYKDITESDIEAVTSYRFYMSESGKINIDYTLSNANSGTVNTKQDTLKTKGINCFVNLESLYLDEEVACHDLDLTGLNKLSVFHAYDLPLGFSEMIDPAQLTSLKLNSSLYLDDFSIFKNIEALELNGLMTLNFDGFEKLEKLKSLTLRNITRIENISELYKIKNLEQFYIDISSFDDITFISEMENIREITIINSKIKSFDLLKNCKKLEKIYLLENYEVEDYSFLKDLTNLIELGVYKNYEASQEVFDFSIYPNLKKLIIGNFENYEKLSGANNIEELIIYHGANTDFKYNNRNILLDFNNLKALEIHDGSIPVEMIADISEIESLEHINLESSYIWDELNPIFELPNLKTLDLTNCTFTLDAESFNGNESIVTLILDNIKPYKYIEKSNFEKEDMDASELESFLQKLSALEYISIE